MKTIKIVMSVLYTIIITPIWFYLLYFILKSVSAGRLEMFLFWVYVPCTIIFGLTIKLVEDGDKDANE